MGSTETERTLGEVFDSVTEDYDVVRQGYPAVLIDAAILRGGLTSGSRVLEVGCGTGKLTESLAARHVVDRLEPAGDAERQCRPERIADREPEERSRVARRISITPTHSSDGDHVSCVPLSHSQNLPGEA